MEGTGSLGRAAVEPRLGRLLPDPDPDLVEGRRRGLGSSGVAASRPAPTAVADPAATPGLAPA